jgi:hypothetical protein
MSGFAPSGTLPHAVLPLEAQSWAFAQPVVLAPGDAETDEIVLVEIEAMQKSSA